MSAQPRSSSASELVPLADRLRYLQVFRLLVMASVIAAALAFPHARVVPFESLALATGGYLLLTVATFAVGRFLHGGGGLLVFGGMLIADGLYLAWTSYGTGGFESPIRYLILLHLITVALLASFRTGLKLALWHSLLLMVVHYAQEARILEPAATSTGLGTPFQQLLAFSGVFWLVTLVTASFSAVNERELRRRRYDLEALARMATRLESASDPREIAGVVIEAVTDTFDFQRAVLLARRGDDSDLDLIAALGAEDAAEAIEPQRGSVVAEAMISRELQLFSALDPEADPWVAALLPGARNLVVVPLSSDNRAIGVLIVEHALKGGVRIHRRVLSMVERFTSHAALALRNAWLLEDARRRAATDGLTGLANRRTFDGTLQRELERAAREHGDATLVLMDIDHFKRLNDTYGHQTGDDVLRRVAASLAEGCRMYDTAARYGGEEFALILPGTTSEDALAIANRLRETIAGDETEPQVTMSAGVATFPAHGTSPHALIEAADGALYRSKENGRNQVTAAASRVDPAPYRFDSSEAA